MKVKIYLNFLTETLLFLFKVFQNSHNFRKELLIVDVFINTPISIEIMSDNPSSVVS